MAEIAWLAALFGVGAALSVGPVFVTILGEAASRGFRPALGVILGSATADLVLLVPALAFGWLVSLAARAAVVVNVIGAAFFAYLAVRAARDARRLWRSGGAAPDRGWAFATGLVSNLVNPLTWIFWLATGTPMMLRADRLGGAAGIALWVLAWFLTASGVEAAIALPVALARRSIRGRGQAVLTGVSAVFFAALAVSTAARAMG